MIKTKKLINIIHLKKLISIEFFNLNTYFDYKNCLDLFNNFHEFIIL